MSIFRDLLGLLECDPWQQVQLYVHLFPYTTVGIWAFRSLPSQLLIYMPYVSMSSVLASNSNHFSILDLQPSSSDFLSKKHSALLCPFKLWSPRWFKRARSSFKQVVPSLAPCMATTAYYLISLNILRVLGAGTLSQISKCSISLYGIVFPWILCLYYVNFKSSLGAME